MKLNNVKHVFFDLDHTLWDFDKNSALTFESIFKEEKLAIELELFLETYIPINHNYWELYRENKITKEALRTGRLRDCFDMMKMEVSPQTIDNLSRNYIKFLPRFNNLLENTIEILEYLQPTYDLHIITNGFQEVQHLKLKNSGIDHFFTTVTTSEEAGVKKPDSGIFKKAFEKANALPENSLMVGDSYEADIIGGERVGMRCLFFDYYNRMEEYNTPTIRKLYELRSYL